MGPDEYVFHLVHDIICNMHIAQVAPPWLEVPPQAYGGTEYVVSLLTEELHRRGHQVTLFATANSQTKAELVPFWPKGVFKDANVKDQFAIFGLLYKELFNRQEQFDIIHDHCEVFTAPFSDFLKPPIVSTLHGLFSEEKIILYKKYPKINYITISSNQRKIASGVHIAQTIHHGIPVERYQFNETAEDYLLWMSNIAPDKGLAKAIEIAKLSREKLIISGPIFPFQSEYFEYRIKPLIDGKQIRFVGTSDFQKKVELLKNAKAFLFPIFQRQEPFGLVVIEAMACGTPVIASKTGSMPELIENGKTGFLVDSTEEALDALRKLNSISRQYCREHIQKKFTLKRMVNRYERLYQRILSTK